MSRSYMIVGLTPAAVLLRRSTPKSPVILDNRLSKGFCHESQRATAPPPAAARADEHLEVLRPFFPILVQFLPAHKELHAAAAAPRIEATDELDWTAEVA